MNSIRNQFRWYDPLALGVISPLVAVLVKSWMLSCRVIKEEGLDKARAAVLRSGGSAVYATWHQRMIYFAHYFGARHVTVMISQSRDGEYAARVADWLGFRNVRGSSTRGGSQALRELVEKIKEGESGAMLADGPQGPAREAKIGSVVMARDASVPLIPGVWGGDRCWILSSWDRYLIPKPFARIVLYWGEPIWVPLEADGEELEAYRRLFEDSLNRGARWCDEQFGPERPWRKVKDAGVPEIGPL